MAIRNAIARFSSICEKPKLWAVIPAAVILLLGDTNFARAGLLVVPNGSFEAPLALFPNPNIDSWQKPVKPDWYDESGPFLWNQLTGLFRNQPPDQPDYIDNCDGTQAMWLFAVPEVGLFQDYDSMDWNDPAPPHAFSAIFRPGSAYRLKVGVIGTGGNMLQGVTLALSLYYRDAASNRVAVATTSVTNTTAVF